VIQKHIPCESPDVLCGSIETVELVASAELRQIVGLCKVHEVLKHNQITPNTLQQNKTPRLPFLQRRQ